MNSKTQVSLSDLPERNSSDVQKYRSGPRKPSGSLLTFDDFAETVCDDDGVPVKDMTAEALRMALWRTMRDSCSVYMIQKLQQMRADTKNQPEAGDPEPEAAA